MEAPLWLLDEYEWGPLDQVAIYTDSTLAGRQSSGDWRIRPDSANALLGRTANLLWRALSPECLAQERGSELKVTAQWVRAHCGERHNERVDQLAKDAANDVPCASIRTSNTADRIEAARVRAAREEARPVRCIPGTAQAHYDICKQALQQTIIDIKPFIPRAAPRRLHIDATCLRIIDARKTAASAGDNGTVSLLCTELKRACRHAKAEFLKSLQSPLDWKGVHRLKPFSPTQCKMSNEAGVSVSTAVRAETIATHFAQRQWHSEPLPVMPDRPPIFPPATMRLSLFTPAELRAALRTLKPRKASGLDGISNEFIGAIIATPAGFSLVLSICNDCWTREVCPDDWAIQRIVALYKGRGPCDKPVSYRPIALINTLSKLLSKLLEARLRIGLHGRISDSQFGFQAGMSVDDAAFRLLRAVDLAEGQRSLPLHAVLLDWNKFYDRVHKEPLVCALRRLGVPDKVCRLLSAMYKHMRFLIRDLFGVSSIMDKAEGLPQGDPLSCLISIGLLTVVMFDAEARWHEACREQNISDDIRTFRELGFHLAQFCDDANLLNTSCRCVELHLHAIQTEGSFYGISLNLDKCHHIRLGAARHDPELSRLCIHDFNGVALPRPISAKTLGFEIGGATSVARTVRQRGGQATAALRQFAPIWNSTLPTRTKIARAYALIISKFLWGIHLLALLDTDFAYLDYVGARILRRILGLTAAYQSRISHADVFARAQRIWPPADPPSRMIKRKQFALLGHILRKPPRHPDRLLIFEPGTDLRPRGLEHRRVGRPRKRWTEDLLQAAVDYTARSHASLLNLAQDRTSWYCLTECLCALVGPAHHS